MIIQKWFLKISLLHRKFINYNKKRQQSLTFPNIIMQEDIPTNIPHHTLHKFSQPKQTNIFFNSCFDSGNLHKVNRNSYDHYSIWTAADAQGTANQGYPKSWFYFQTGGFINRKVAFSIHRVHFLWAVSKRPHMYRPVYKICTNDGQESKWQRLPHPIISLCLNEQQQLVLKFDFFFSALIKSIKFAFLYPYSYEDQVKELQKLKSEYQNDDQIFYKQYDLIKSYQKRTIHMVLISSHEGKQGYQDIKYDQFFDIGQKLTKFRSNKPIIFVSARVHPIQTPSSYCMKGIIQFLLNKKDFRAHLLRKYFVFVLVPMLNPDGVSNGHCRMDHLNQNLNRFYKTPDPIKQPSCYAVRKLCEHYQKDKRMFMYLDLHAHPAIKGNFMFGNAIYDFIEQVQSQVFPKILSQNCINFQFQNCIFSRKHMKAKDRNEDMNKQGCGRVVLYKDFGIPHAYTLQCGYHANAFNNVIAPQKNPEQKYLIRYHINKQGQKIYENFQKLCTNQMQNRIKQNQKKKQQQKIQYQKIQSKKRDKQLIEYQQKQNTEQELQQKITQNNDEDQQVTKLKRSATKLQQQKGQKGTRQTIKQNKMTGFKPHSKLPQRNTSTNNNYYCHSSMFQYTASYLDNIQDLYYKREVAMYNTQAYENIGRNILITILDIFNKNPYSRSIDLNQRRKEIAQKQSKLDRFRKQQAGIRSKMKNIVDLVEEQFYSQWYKRNVFNHIDSAPTKARRNKTLQFQITKSSQNKARLTGKQIQISDNKVQGSKRQILLQSEVIKTSVQGKNQSIHPITSLNKIITGQKSQQYQNRTILVSKKLKSIQVKQKVTRQQYTKIEVSKKSIPILNTQGNISLEEEGRLAKNEISSTSSKVIKTGNLTNLRARNFVIQATGNKPQITPWTQQTHSLSTQHRK